MSIFAIPFYKRYFATISYIVMIIAVNSLFTIIPTIKIYNAIVSPADITVGIIYVMRDLAQREVKHYVILAMLTGGALSYFLADKQIAIASISSFLIAEFIDWGIYTFTKKPLSQRIVWSASISSPIDTAVFLYLVNMLNWAGMFIMTGAKIFGVFLVWYIWRQKNIKNQSEVPQSLSPMSY